MHRDDNHFALRDMFEAPDGAQPRGVLRSHDFERHEWRLAGRAHVVVDRFPGAGGIACCFVRLAPSEGSSVRFLLDTLYGLRSCRSGGWLLEPAAKGPPTYWIPRGPVLRAYDANGRILSEETGSLVGFEPGRADTIIEVETHGQRALECVAWCLPPEASDIVEALERPQTLERQPVFMWSSHAAFRGPADVYACLLHGHVYENRFDFRSKRKICSELEAYALYAALNGLEAATGKRLYRLLKRQIVYSVIARQTPDGGWQHGEWTDFMESHYRFHTGAMLALEAALEESPDDAVREALDKAAALIASRADETDIGAWFPHDSLEQDAETMDRSGARWIASRELGKSPANKMILNTHLDAIVALDRYREVRGDVRYGDRVESALGATRALLALRPAEWLYRPLYRAVSLTLLPPEEAARLPLPLRAVKRLTRDYIVPQLHRIKRRFPRMVMPGGIIERHLSRLHFGVNYHTVNIADLARVLRRFPREDLDRIVDGAIAAVTRTSLLRYWVESKQRQPLGYWVEALYHLCTLRPEATYRRLLAQAMLGALDAGLALSPSLLGANPEAVKSGERVPCPSPADARLRVANLSVGGRREILVVNPTQETLELAWDRTALTELAWSVPEGRAEDGGRGLRIPARAWAWGRPA